MCEFFSRNVAITLIYSDLVPHLFHALCTSWFMYNVIMDLRVSLTYIFIMCVAVFTVTATKESIDNAEVAVLAKRLYDEIKKRLHDYGDKVDGLQDVDMSKFSLQNETIIKTTSSIKRGAKFLNNSVVESREECAKLCFTNVQCNIAVFHNKKSFSCYLFNCGAPSVCEFSSHPDYLTMGLPLRKTGLGQQKKHESDLANLSASITSDSTTTTTTTTATTSVSTSSPTTTTTSTTTTTTTQTEPKIGKVQVALFEKCGPMLGECADRYTECLTGFCVCKEGYHPQDGACRKECDRFEFECANVGRPLVYPQCIAVYDKCDGIAQCLDGSDELNCPAGARHASPDQVTHIDTAGSKTFTSLQQLQHEQEIKQLLQPPNLPTHTSGETQQGTEDLHHDTPAIVGSGGGAMHQDYPKIRVKSPVRQGKGEGDEGVLSHVGETHAGGTSKGDVRVESTGDHTRSGIDGSRPVWNGESSEGHMSSGQGRTKEDKGHIRFDASRHRGIDGQDPLAGTGPELMDGTMRGNMMRKYEPVVDGNDPQSTGRWTPSSRNRVPDSYRSKAVDRLDSGGYGRGGDFVNHEVDKPTDDGGISSDPADYNYRYYKVHRPSGGDGPLRTPGSGFDKGYIIGGDRGPWHKTGHYTGDVHPGGGPAMGNDRNKAGYYYPRNPDQEGHGDYDSYYDNNGRKGYYNNDDGPGLFLPYRHHEVFDYYAPETALKDGDKLIDEHKNGGEAPIKTKILPLPVGDKSTVPPVKAVTVEPAKMVSDSAGKAQLPGLGKNDTSSTSGNKKIMHSKNITDINVQPEPHKTTGSLGSEVVENREEVVIINKEVIGSAIVHHEAKSDRGAVVALGLGLAVTAILLLFVGCRLRNMKRKLRRGRPMNSNEADYLINGMYL